MVVSFVNAGLMNLYQAAGVILGANIGTTVTSQLVSFNISKYAPVILLAGVVSLMFSKKEKTKDFAEIIMQVRGDVPEDYEFSFRLLGNVDGYELPGGKPHRGEFDYSPPREPGHVYRARVPRQLDDSLMLEIYHSDGSLVTRQKLGMIMRMLGYDWSSPDLKDIMLGVDLAAASFTIEVEEWDNSETIKIIM